jgi:pyruvate formate lyase activating enzyme
VFKEANERGFLCGFVSNGNATPEALDFLQPWIRCYKVDLKTFDDRRYRSLGGTLAHVLETVRAVHARGLWLEVLTLLVPGWNDSEDELRDIARFVASVSPEIPWHVTAFHPDYQMTGPRQTTAADLIRAAEIGAGEGLQFVYAGNLPGRVGEWENTRCPGCQRTLIARRGYCIREDRLTGRGNCPDCGRVIPGVWQVPDRVMQ